MKKNVYTKSVLRQPVHSLILAFLLFIATFSFVLRTVEFLTVRNQIFTISEYFQSVGVLQGTDEFDDVNIGADFLENNPYIELSDRRRVVEGFLQDVLNSAISDPNGITFRVRRGDFFGQLPQDLFHGELHDAIFYGELVDKTERGAGSWHLVFTVDEVLVGYPEHAVTGQSDLRMNFDLQKGNEFAIDGLVIGERYLLRGIFDSTLSPIIDAGFWIPEIGDSRDLLLMQPLYSDGLWYIHTPHGEEVDFTDPQLELILEEVEKLQRNHHSIQLRTTKDMASIPNMLDVSEMGFMVEGRPIEYDDYLFEKPVAVIHYQFASIRGLSISDKFTVEIPLIHYANRRHSIEFSGASGHQTFSDVRVEGAWQSSQMYELELEIVGIYNLFGRLGGDPSTTFSTHIYIPDSILPDDMVITSNRWQSREGQNFLPPTWYSFRLSNPRDEVAFIAQYRQPLEALGFSLTMVGGDAQNFWTSADVILQAITFNVVVFCVVLVLVLMLVIFLFLRQRKKEFTISRLLGYSAMRCVGQVLSTAILFLIPIATGSVLAWIFARVTIVNTLVVFEELHDSYAAVFSLSPLWLLGLTMIVFMLAMLMVFIGAMFTTHRPVLQMLQRK